MNNYIQEGDRIDVTAPYAATSGQGVLVGTALFGVAVAAYASGDAGVLATRGVFDIAKETGPSLAAGARAYWNDTTKVVTTSGTASALEVGIAVAAAGTAATTARIKLKQNP